MNKLILLLLFWAWQMCPLWAQPSEGMVQTGRATFYAKRFKGRYTASGERLSLKALTAAHKTLPFGTLVEVTHIKTGKSAIVRINDRGPHVKGCVIDLTPAAAKKIGLSLRAGNAPVMLRTLTVGEPTGRKPKTTTVPILIGKVDNANLHTGLTYTPDGKPVRLKGYALQVGAYFTKASAFYDAASLTQAGYKEVFVQVHCSEKQEELYRVLVGQFPNREKALYIKPKLAKAGWESVVFRFVTES